MLGKAASVSGPAFFGISTASATECPGVIQTLPDLRIRSVSPTFAYRTQYVRYIQAGAEGSRHQGTRLHPADLKFVLCGLFQIGTWRMTD